MSVEVYKTPEMKAECAADDSINILQGLFNRISQQNLGYVREGEPKVMLSFDDLYDDIDPSEEMYDSRRVAIAKVVDCICEDWRNKATIRMLSFPREGRAAYLGAIESKMSDFIINRNLNRDSSEGAAYMGRMLKRAVAGMRGYVPRYDAFEERWPSI